LKPPGVASILKDMYPAAIDPLALNRRPPQPCKPWIRIVYVLACTTALLVASYLTVMKLTGRLTDLAGCGGDGGCAGILGGRWANWFRIPVSLWAVGIYVPLLMLGIMGLTTLVQRRLTLIGTSILVGAAVWFLYIQAVVERQFCPYCLVLHVCGLIAFACVLGHVWSRDLTERAVSLLAASGVASLAMLALVTGQFLGPQPDTHQITVEDPLGVISEASIAEADQLTAEPVTADVPTTARGQDVASPPASDADDPDADSTRVAQDSGVTNGQTAAAPVESDSSAEPATVVAERGRMVTYFDGVISLPLNEMPLIGRRDARHILLKYFDYTCSSCRRMHNDLAVALAAYPQDLAVIVIPCPLNRDCNPHADEAASRARGPGSHEHACELARLALAMWRIAPQEFERFHNELFARQGRMTPGAAILVGNRMIDQDRLEDATNDPWIDALLKHSVGIYGRMKRSNPRMPKLLLADRTVLHGVAVSPDALVKVLRQQFHLGESKSKSNSNSNSNSSL
jgi:uncharacterized membrane protein